MKFTVSSSDLQKSLAKVSGVVPSKSTLPILENILFSLSKNALTLLATDLEVSMSVTIDVQGAQDGVIAIPAKRLLDTVRALPEVQIHLHADESSKKIQMVTESGEYNLVGEAGEDFPSGPQFKAENELHIPAPVIETIINQTLFSVSADELRPAMTGVYFQIKQDNLIIVATDGHRLVRLSYSGTKTSITKDLIVPAKALHLASRSIEKEDLKISVDSTHIQFHFGATVLTSRLIEEKYPNYESVIPLDNDKQLTVARDLLLASVKRVALYSSSTTHQVRFIVSKSELKIAAEDVDFGGEARETVACSFAGEDIEIGFNATYVIDILSHIESEDVVFQFSSPVRAAVITPAENKPQQDVLMLAMPMRLNS
jgi:DNA polymerase-3 subunit beta